MRLGPNLLSINTATGLKSIYGFRSNVKKADFYKAFPSTPAAVSVHSLRVTALTTARERGSDIIDLQDFAGHADPRTTLTYIRSRDRLSRSPAYVLRY